MNYVDLSIPYDDAENYLLASNKEKMKTFFYKGTTFDNIQKNTTYYIVGDKGSGKTAYAAYYCNNTVSKNIRSKIYKISVDDYNKIIGMKKDNKLNYTHYSTLWKAVILIKICSSLDPSEISVFGKNGYNKIRSLLNAYDFTKFTVDDFSPVTFMDSKVFNNDYAIETEKSGIKPSIQQSKTLTEQMSQEGNVYTDNWVKFINAITEEISRLRLKNTHYLFIDGIDNRPEDISFDDYSRCVYPLIRAVYDVNTSIFSKIKDNKKGRLQVVLLTRLDIFLKAGLNNPGNKLSDNCAYLDWNTNEKKAVYENSAIYNVVNNIISSTEGSSIKWDTFFNYDIKRGNKKYPNDGYFLFPLFIS